MSPIETKLSKANARKTISNPQAESLKIVLERCGYLVQCHDQNWKAVRGTPDAVLTLYAPRRSKKICGLVDNMEMADIVVAGVQTPDLEHTQIAGAIRIPLETDIQIPNIFGIFTEKISPNLSHYGEIHSATNERFPHLIRATYYARLKLPESLSREDLLEFTLDASEYLSELGARVSHVMLLARDLENRLSVVNTYAANLESELAAEIGSLCGHVFRERANRIIAPLVP
ncbi:MAG: hypothetical protein AABX38_06665 [Candidatus Micrarchaeota archaeon]